MIKTAIYGRKFDTKDTPYIQNFINILEQKKIHFRVYDSFYENLKTAGIKFASRPKLFADHKELASADYLFSLGGDGTLLDTITLVRDSQIPIMGINTGRLGFLSSISKEAVEMAINNLLEKNFLLDPRTLIKLNTEKQLFGELNYALNEITIHKKDTASMIVIHTYIDGEYLNSYWADGLIISTPTGSTGYSLSCGGPIIVPGTDNFVLNPIAPHNLNVRPIVVPASSEIKLKVEGRNQHFWVTLDSRSETIDASTELIITKAGFKIKLVKLHDQNFFKTIRNKLMWGIDKRN
jgi:NAD+ kinase